MLATCRRCSRLFSSRITAQATGPRFCNPGAPSFLTCRRSWRAQRRIGYSLGIEPYGVVSKIKRRADRAESGPGHFILLRSGHEEITKAIRDISPSSRRNREICQRSRAHPHGAAQTNPSRTPTKSLTYRGHHVILSEAKLQRSGRSPRGQAFNLGSFLDRS